MKIPRKAFDASVPSMAMGDIAFLLLIFFVILAKAQDDSHLQWVPAEAVELQPSKNSRATVVIDVENDTYLNGQQIGVAQLADAISDRLGNAPAGDRLVQLKVHRDVTAVYFEPVIEAISEAGGDMVHILEQNKLDQPQNP